MDAMVLYVRTTRESGGDGRHDAAGGAHARAEVPITSAMSVEALSASRCGW